ncbi:hypothetical protein [Sphingopyxis panaciterrulae]|uniref:Uncharacterized protein n=1 Tax=Sphingopyxis panaciterrulae TaxID=462372 RepID=A0A7W9B9K9_9SPHN|nr:hypothetical protein [Sphingopyxis panaciterrulae]MBB5708746.1 hypothetical protein [Sphingopyxis panaciterrulae]
MNIDNVTLPQAHTLVNGAFIAMIYENIIKNLPIGIQPRKLPKIEL